MMKIVTNKNNTPMECFVKIYYLAKFQNKITPENVTTISHQTPLKHLHNFHLKNKYFHSTKNVLLQGVAAFSLETILL